MASELRPGLGVDSAGGPVVDPTKNVLDLVEAAVKRIDDMAGLRARLAEERIEHVKEIGVLRAAHQRELDHAESERLNSIRQVDREEVTKTAAANQAAITTLATSTATLAETLRTQVAVTASAAESRQTTSATEISKRLQALELSASASMGKQAVADPQLDRLATVVDRLASAQQVGTGKGQGIALVIAIIVTGLGVIGSMVALATAGVALVLFLNRAGAAQSPVYVSPPATTVTPPPMAK